MRDTTRTRWSLGLLSSYREDTAESGISARRGFIPSKEVWWPLDATGEQIAEKLRELANMLEAEG